MEFGIIIGLVFAAFLFIIYRNKQKKLALQLNIKKAIIEEAVKIFETYLNYTQYFNYRRLKLWTEKYKPIFDSLPKKFSTLPLEKKFTKDLKSFIDYYSNHAKYRDEANQKFITRELNSNKLLFDSLESYPLTERQREAIVSDEDNNLIIAGAGTGKTSTLLGKIIYLLKPRNIKPEKILVLAFTRKASDEIKERIKSKTHVEMDIKTFHKFGLDIITSIEGVKPSVAFTDESGDELKIFINSTHRELLKQPKYQTLLSTYFLSYLRPYKNPDAFKNQGEYFKICKIVSDFKRRDL